MISQRPGFRILIIWMPSSSWSQSGKAFVFWDEVSLFKNTPSAFDQMLEEDPKTNRLVGSSSFSVSSLTSPYPYQYDSAQLWKEVVSNKHLQQTNLILFLNKVDVFQQKLAAGVQFSDHVTSYHDRENDFQSISVCKHVPLPLSFEMNWSFIDSWQTCKGSLVCIV